MRPFEYKPPRVHAGELRTKVHFHQFQKNEGVLPGGGPSEKLYTAWAKVESVYLRDVEMAKANGTLSDITIMIRDPHASYRPRNQHLIKVEHPDYEGFTYQIKSVQPDPQAQDFINVIAEVKT